MKGPFQTLDEARAVANPGEEIWARDSVKAPDRTGWCVMSKEEADEYARAGDPLISFYARWQHWETIK